MSLPLGNICDLSIIKRCYFVLTLKKFFKKSWVIYLKKSCVIAELKFLVYRPMLHEYNQPTDQCTYLSTKMELFVKIESIR